MDNRNDYILVIYFRLRRSTEKNISKDNDRKDKNSITSKQSKMKYYKTRHKIYEQLNEDNYEYYHFFGDVLQHSLYVNPNEGIELDKADDETEVNFNYSHIHKSDNLVVKEIKKEEFMKAYLTTRDFITNQVL